MKNSDDAGNTAQTSRKKNRPQTLKMMADEIRHFTGLMSEHGAGSKAFRMFLAIFKVAGP